MAQPYVGEIRMFAGNFAPVGWNFCDGTIVAISENETLFNLIGTTYGGDGQNTFGLPDLRGRIPLHMGSGFTLAQSGGVESVALTVSQIPAHDHPFMGSSNIAVDANLANDVVAEASLFSPYLNVNPSTPMASQSLSIVGNNQPHTNFQPYLCVNFIISMFGIFPSQT